MTKQLPALSSMVEGGFSLVPPNSKEFRVYGGKETIRRARQWALDHEVLLFDGPAAHCVHGLYRMDSCMFKACRSVGLDHTNIWVERNGRGAFLLTHPYARDVPDSIRTYAEMHGLTVDTYPFDGWYHEATLPIRLTIPTSWPLWPIERDAVVVLHTQPITWPTESEES